MAACEEGIELHNSPPVGAHVTAEPLSIATVVTHPQVARGEAVGAAWMMTGGAHDNSAVCIRDSELVRMSRVRVVRAVTRFVLRAHVMCWLAVLDGCSLSLQQTLAISVCRHALFATTMSTRVPCPNHSDARSCALQGSFELLAQVAPKAVARILEGMARRMSPGSSTSDRYCTCRLHSSCLHCLMAQHLWVREDGPWQDPAL